ncbi:MULTISPECIES: hypothetical protein [unclassified Pseudoalteromonas]|uniref:hypothetical protein n=1 Tax=unclassified Pseudoalteromonas TaxID=194690 RepID=UPI000BBED238|nr:hypothetical protein [Pseudoalteromonas sp. 1_2015MBL_MicDiv]ATG76433.1 hypothetical protein AOR04_02125 [Pseudoalteromonas sp. 1_2015MBL_MicDiv]
MYAQVEKSKENKSIAIVNSVAQRRLQSQVKQRVKSEAFLVPIEGSQYTGSGWAGSGPGELFSSGERHSLLGNNKTKTVKKETLIGSFDLLSDDNDGSRLLSPGDLSTDLAAVDHIVPKAGGGGNHPANAQIISYSKNSSKSDSYPWGPFKGDVKVYNPANDHVYKNTTTAKAYGANVTELEKTYNSWWLQDLKTM